MRTVHFLLALVVVMMTCACAEKELKPIHGSKGKPGKVEIIEQEAIPGGVVVVYRIPESEDILSVVAQYTLTNGKNYKSEASYFENTLTIAGFNDHTKEYTAQLFTVNRAQQRSDPVTVTFRPEESSLSKTARSMEITADWGGSRFSWINEDKQPLIFEFFAPDEEGNFRIMRVLGSTLASTSYVLRGYEPKPQRFATVIRDYWDNVTDTIYPPGGKLTPWLEQKPDKSKMRVMGLGEPNTPNGDAGWNMWGSNPGYMLNDISNQFGEWEPIPASATFDLGVTLKLSRLVHFHRIGSDFPNPLERGNPKRYEIYGYYGGGVPSQSGNWSEWTLIMEHEEMLPASGGKTSAERTPEDMDFVREYGQTCEIPLTAEPTRYLRIKVLQTWGNTRFASITRLDFYGEIQK